tara:strand:+ start:2858 stop:3286 length:429 start_codon:yes stop_codon:yes gene_type:complete
MRGKITQRGRLKLSKCMPVVCAFFGCTPKDVLDKSKTKVAIHARHSLRYYMSKGNDLTFAEIGSLTNGDHSSVINSIKKFNLYVETEFKYKQFKEHINGNPFKFENCITRLDEQLRKTETYNTLPLGAKIDFLKNFIEQNGY